MSKKMLSLMSPKEEELLVDLTFHNVPSSLLKEFMLQIVKPYYSGSLTEAIKELMEKAVADNEFILSHTETK